MSKRKLRAGRGKTIRVEQTLPEVIDAYVARQWREFNQINAARKQVEGYLRPPKR